MPIRLKISVASGLAALVLVLFPVEAGAGAPECMGRRANLVGTPRGERILGTPGDDVIVARGGGDEIYGFQG
ncbi:MAG: hypothetical protein M3174_02550, partial [Actinomycetota bacterium]|nr:hypothetical protein [Actinomycetota bacterium]